MTAFYIVIAIGSVVAIFFPFSALFGFYDDREDGAYRFRTGRFFSIIGALSIIPVIGIIILMLAVGNLVTGATKVAETAVAKNRAMSLHIQDDISTVFPDILNAQTAPCYTAAVSSYVQEEWAKSYRDETCKMDKGLCADNEQIFFEAARQKRNPYLFPLLDLDPIGLMLETVWTTAKDMYETIRSFQGILDPSKVGQPRIGTDTQNYEAFRQYFVSCATLKPAPWIVPGAPLITSPAGICLGGCQ